MSEKYSEMEVALIKKRATTLSQCLAGTPLKLRGEVFNGASFELQKRGEQALANLLRKIAETYLIMEMKEAEDEDSPA